MFFLVYINLLEVKIKQKVKENVKQTKQRNQQPLLFRNM